MGACAIEVSGELRETGEGCGEIGPLQIQTNGVVPIARSGPAVVVAVINSNGGNISAGGSDVTADLRCGAGDVGRSTVGKIGQ